MRTQRLLKLLHLCGTAWFIVAATYILVVALRQAGVGWWLIFSLSGNGAAIAFLFVSAYLYALFGNNARDPQKACEHPLTNSGQYLVLYSFVPFLGAAAGLFSIVDSESDSSLLTATAMGTLAATFLFWVFLDPVISGIERFLPASRKHRVARKAAIKAAREQKLKEQALLLVQYQQQEDLRQTQWQAMLAPDAQKLADLTLRASNGDSAAELIAVEVGLSAWKTGGHSCMKKLYDMATDQCRNGNLPFGPHYISAWWDGIGDWHHKLPTSQ